MSQKPPVPCGCGAGAARDFLFSARDYISGDEFQIIRCGGCRVVFTVPVPERWERYYPPAYYGDVEAGRFPPSSNGCKTNCMRPASGECKY